MSLNNLPHSEVLEKFLSTLIKSIGIIYGIPNNLEDQEKRFVELKVEYMELDSQITEADIIHAYRHNPSWCNCPRCVNTLRFFDFKVRTAEMEAAINATKQPGDRLTAHLTNMLVERGDLKLVENISRISRAKIKANLKRQR